VGRKPRGLPDKQFQPGVQQCSSRSVKIGGCKPGFRSNAGFWLCNNMEYLEDDRFLLDLASCSLEEADRRFRCAYCLYRQGEMEAVRTLETLVYFYETICLNIPEGCRLHTLRRENLKSHRDFLDYLNMHQVETASFNPVNVGFTD
jgi:hypothetical protein